MTPEAAILNTTENTGVVIEDMVMLSQATHDYMPSTLENMFEEIASDLCDGDGPHQSITDLMGKDANIEFWQANSEHLEDDELVSEYFHEGWLVQLIIKIPQDVVLAGDGSLLSSTASWGIATTEIVWVPVLDDLPKYMNQFAEKTKQTAIRKARKLAQTSDQTHG